MSPTASQTWMSMGITKNRVRIQAIVLVFKLTFQKHWSCMKWKSITLNTELTKYLQITWSKFTLLSRILAKSSHQITDFQPCESSRTFPPLGLKPLSGSCNLYSLLGDPRMVLHPTSHRLPVACANLAVCSPVFSWRCKGDLVKRQSWLSRSEWGPEILHFSHSPRRCCCCVLWTSLD